MGRPGNAQSRLIAMAMALMYVRGYTAVGVHEICPQAGVYKPMVLVYEKLNNHTGILQTKLSNGEGHEARRVGL